MDVTLFLVEHPCESPESLVPAVSVAILQMEDEGADR